MNLSAHLIASAIIFVVAVVSAIIIFVKSKNKSKRSKYLFYIVFTGLFIGTCVILLPVYYPVCDNRITPFLFSVTGALQIFTIGIDVHDIFNNLGADFVLETAHNFYSGVISVLMVLAPALTFAFVISFFKNFFNYIHLFFLRNRDLYIFSEINDRSIALSKDIRKNYPKSCLIFTDVYEEDNETFHENFEAVCEIGAVCFQKDILSLKINRFIHSKNRKIIFLTIGYDDSENINQSLRIIKMYSSMPNSNLYVFSSSKQSEMLLANTGNTVMKVRRIDENLSMINYILDNKGVELFQGANPASEDGVRIIHAVIVGLGGFGLEMLKSLTWYCQMLNYRIVIDAFEKNKDAENELTAMCPDLMSNLHNGKYESGDSEYLIRVHSGVNDKSKEFFDAISSYTDLTYALVATGTDENNVNTAINIRMLCERNGIKPKIQAIFFNSDLKDYLTEIKNEDKDDYGIEFIGDLKSVYACDVIFNSKLEESALEIHRSYYSKRVKIEKKDEYDVRDEGFWKLEYNYRSSIASAIHRKSRLMCNIPGADKEESECTDEEKNILAQIEVRRWNAYMRSQGYIFAGDGKKSRIAKVHCDLVNAEDKKHIEYDIIAAQQKKKVPDTEIKKRRKK